MLYSYKCDVCGHVFDEHCPMKDRKKTKQCPMCLQPASWNFAAQIKGSKIDVLMQEHERWSWSMGVNRQDIAAAERRYPGSKYDHMGRLQIKHRQDKLNKMKERGMEEQ